MFRKRLLFVVMGLVAIFAVAKTFDWQSTNVETPVGNEKLQDRFAPPPGYHRAQEPGNSFGTFLRQLPLKPNGSLVHYFDGRTKPNADVYAAVFDLPIGTRNLHQCADAVMRLRADYFYQQKAYDQIHFKFTSGFNAEYARWRKGQRISVKGNSVKWTASAKPSDSRESYWKYLEMVFTYAGTASLSKELHPVKINDLKIGDVFIKGGFPGHAAIVVDVVEDGKGHKLFMLAQSYMPAQELQVLQNPAAKKGEVWYSTAFGNTLQTPEWVFQASELKRF